MSSLAAESIVLPIDNSRIDDINTALRGLSSAQLTWVSGYVLGLAAQDTAVPAPEPGGSSELAILYGSQTGNGEGVARALKERAEAAGFARSRSGPKRPASASGSRAWPTTNRRHSSARSWCPSS